jgi:cadmium resistance protein CadD (predicted permease)
MQKIATRIFIFASLAFGVLGILIVLFELDKDNKSELDILLMKSFMITVFVILPSFALSVAGKYLNRNKQ